MQLEPVGHARPGVAADGAGREEDAPAAGHAAHLVIFMLFAGMHAPERRGDEPVLRGVHDVAAGRPELIDDEAADEVDLEVAVGN